MRKSNTTRNRRLVRAGIASAAVGAAVVIAPQAAFAVGTASPYVVAPGSTVSVTDASYTYANTHQVEFNSSACGTHYLATNTSTVFAPTVAISGASHTITVTVPTTIVTNTNGAGKAYNVCVYDTSNATTSALLTNAAAFVAAVPTVNPLMGPTLGTNSLTVTAPTANPVFTAATSIGATFTTGACAATYGTPATGMSAADATKTSATVVTLTVPAGVVATGGNATNYNVCLYNGNTSTGTLLTAVPYMASAVALSQNSGPTTGGNGLTVTSVDPSLFGGISPGVVFVNAADCSGTATYTTTGTSTVLPVTPATTRKLADNRLALTVPAVTNGNWQACIYSANTNGNGSLLAAVPYTVTAPAVPTSVSPSAGPTNGGTTITVYGTGFPTDAGSISATLGGVPLVSITPRTTTSFTAVTPTHSVDPASTLVVTTANGTKALLNAFAFQNSLKLRPNTAPNTTPAIDVEVTGAGFLGDAFGSSGTAARVWLVRGAYNSADRGGSAYANGPVTECSNVLVIGDNSLICSLQLNRRLSNAGTAFDPVTYTNTTNTSGPATTPAIGSRTIDATAGSFSLDDLGQVIGDGGVCIPAGTTITAVLSTTRIVMSNAATCATVVPHLTIGAAAVHSFTGTLSVAAGSLGALTTTSANPFSQADVGRVISGAATLNSGNGIANGTTITSVSPNGLSATLSAPSVAALTSVNGTLFPAAPVPNGAYTMTVVSNGAVDAVNTDSTFQQSAVTSGATFTVAPA